MIIRTFSNSTLDYDPDLGHTTLEELLVFTGLVLWTLQGNISDSLYTVYIEGLMLSCVRYFVMLLFLTAIMLTEKSYRIRVLALLAAIPEIVPLQLFAYHVARANGCDIDKPRNLAKSVTVE